MSNRRISDRRKRARNITLTAGPILGLLGAITLIAVQRVELDVGFNLKLRLDGLNVRLEPQQVERLQPQLYNIQPVPVEPTPLEPGLYQIEPAPSEQPGATSD
jgi:hypothetical protein